MTVQARELTPEQYPARLRDLPEPPAVLYTVGELPEGPAAAIVGTRDCTQEGERYAFELARELSRHGVTIFSGGARGIDAAAHRGALAAGGATVVVAASSFDLPSPSSNATLFQEVVAAGGAYVTLHPSGTSARRHHYFPRNTLLAAFSQVLVVVESRLIGGARNAAKAARDLGRPLLVVPGTPWNPVARGCLLELQLGAKMVTSARDVLHALELEVIAEGRIVGSPARRRPSDPPDPERDAVLSELDRAPASPDSLCAATGVPAPRLQALLLTLTLEGVVVSDPAGRISLVNP